MFTIENFISLIGWVGSIEILIAYWLISSERVSAKSKTYQILNLTGSAFLIVLTYYTKAFPATFLNVVWFIIAGITLAQLLRKPKKS